MKVITELNFKVIVSLSAPTCTCSCGSENVSSTFLGRTSCKARHDWKVGLCRQPWISRPEYYAYISKSYCNEAVINAENIMISIVMILKPQDSFGEFNNFFLDSESAISIRKGWIWCMPSFIAVAQLLLSLWTSLAHLWMKKTCLYRLLILFPSKLLQLKKRRRGGGGGGGSILNVRLYNIHM